MTREERPTAARRRTRRDFLKLATVAASALGLSGLLEACSSSPPPPTAAPAPTSAAPAPQQQPPQPQPAKATAPPKSGGSVVVALSAQPVTLDPAQTRSTGDDKVHANIHDALVSLKPGTCELMPGLAERWDISADGLAYTFHLRKEVKFHDGTPFDAESVKFTFERELDKSHPYFDVGTYPNIDSRVGTIKSVEVVNESTARIFLKEPFAPFLDYLSTYAGFIISPAAVKKHGKEITSNPVGTGPFRFKTWEKNQRIVLERNPDYWGEKAKLDQLIYIFLPEAQARLAALRTGTADFVEGIPPDNIAALKSDTSVNLLSGNSPHVWYMVMNLKNFEPFRNVKVRQAMNYGVDREAIVRDILRGTAIVAKGPLSPVFAPYNPPDLKAYSYDPAKAKQLLAEAGFASGFSVRFDLPTSGTGMQSPVPMATLIQANLAQVGVKVEIKTYEWTDYANNIRVPGAFQLAAFPWTPSIGNPDIMLYRKFHSSVMAPAGNNNGFYQNEALDKLLAEARRTTDLEKQRKLYQDAQRIIVEDGNHIFVDHETAYVATTKKVAGFQFSPSGKYYFNTVYLSD